MLIPALLYQKAVAVLCPSHQRNVNQHCHLIGNIFVQVFLFFTFTSFSVLYFLFAYLLLLNFAFCNSSWFYFLLWRISLFLLFWIIFYNHCALNFVVNGFTLRRRTTGPVRRARGGWTEEDVSLWGRFILYLLSMFRLKFANLSLG